MSKDRVTLKTAREAVRGKRIFYGSNLFSLWEGDRYVVYSYGKHFPMYVWEPTDEQWYANEDRFSPSTSRQQSACNPSPNAIPVPTHFLKQIALNGLESAIINKIQRGE